MGPNVLRDVLWTFMEHASSWTCCSHGSGERLHLLIQHHDHSLDPAGQSTREGAIHWIISEFSYNIPLVVGLSFDQLNGALDIFSPGHFSTLHMLPWSMVSDDLRFTLVPRKWNLPRNMRRVIEWIKNKLATLCWWQINICDLVNLSVSFIAFLLLLIITPPTASGMKLAHSGIPSGEGANPIGGISPCQSSLGHGVTPDGAHKVREARPPGMRPSNKF